MINDIVIPFLMDAESSIRVAYLFLQIDEFDKEKSDSLPPAL
jgi:hypothetical protein